MRMFTPPSRFRLARKRTKVLDRAFGTLRLFGEADAAAVVLHQVAEADALFFRDDCRQVSFDFVRVGLGREAEALLQARDVGVDADGLPAEGVAEDDVCGFSTNTGQ